MRAIGLDLPSRTSGPPSQGRWVRRGRTLVVDLRGHGHAQQGELLGEIGEELESEVGDPNARWLQDALNRVLGTRLTVDGKAGPETRSALRSFQQRYGLQVDGVAGPKTREKLMQLLGGQTVPASVRLNCDQMVRLILDEFELDKDQLRPHHHALINEIARCIAESIGTDTEVIDIWLMGHADRSGPDQYNLNLGLRRATRVEAALSTALNARGLRGRFTMIPMSGGEQYQRGTPGQSRRVEVTLVRRQPRRVPVPPPRDRQCEALCNQACHEQFRRCVAASTDPLRCLASRQSCMAGCRQRCLRPPLIL